MNIEPIIEPGPFEAVQRIILASGSPRRREMLESLGLEFDIIPSPAGEPSPEPGESPDDYAQRAAVAKAEAVFELHPDAVVIGSDTVVTLDGDIMGKPEGPNDALLMLSRLVGNTHRVVSGCAIFHPHAAPVAFSVSTDVSMGPQPLEVLFAYVATGEPMDKAGSYAIQGRGGFLVQSISGSYNNVVGMPLARLVDVLQDIRAIRPRPMDR
ncbi:septum formation protein [Desulfobaculum xiamenense]|uniref:dTTP/UTP pyrophosphatase n=1 Tax=Desulfobaculum xiamenense TaxID=995050 RepID=A0A846QRR6_9BACT|nr:Maf family protein [Desulfobaculum xiamenense]NJB67359.1 septum formation protein [Desulfobaculum xiamenense]